MARFRPIGFLKTRVGICFGSDSNIQIDLLEDARLLEYHLRMNRLERAVLAPPSGRTALAQRLFESATESGAAALAIPVGTLETGKPADFFTVDLNDPCLAGADPASLLNHIVFSLERTAIREVCVDGEMQIQDCHHAREEEIVQDFSRAPAAPVDVLTMQTAADILLDLVAIPSVSSMSNQPVIDYVLRYLDPSYWTVELHNYRDSSGTPKANLVATASPRPAPQPSWPSSATPTLCLSSPIGKPLFTR